MAKAAGETAEAAGTSADERPAIPAGRRAAHRSARAPRDPREIRALRPFARPPSRCRCRTDAGDHERDLGETRAPGRTRVPGTVAGVPGTRSARASLPQASLPQASLPQASLPQASLPQASLPQASLPRASLLRASLPRASLPRAGLPRASLPRAGLLRTGEMPPQAPAVPTRAVPAPIPPRPVARGPTAVARAALASSQSRNSRSGSGRSGPRGDRLRRSRGGLCQSLADVQHPVRLRTGLARPAPPGTCGNEHDDQRNAADQAARHHDRASGDEQVRSGLSSPALDIAENARGQARYEQDHADNGQPAGTARLLRAPAHRSTMACRHHSQCGND